MRSIAESLVLWHKQNYADFGNGFERPSPCMSLAHYRADIMEANRVYYVLYLEMVPSRLLSTYHYRGRYYCVKCRAEITAVPDMASEVLEERTTYSVFYCETLPFRGRCT